MDLDAQSLDRIAHHFGQRPWSHATPLTGGWTNHSYTVGEGESRWVLTISPGKTTASLEPLLAVHQTLEAADFPTSRYHPASGAFEHRGQAVTLRTHIAGEVPQRLEAEGVAQIGEALATLHALAPPACLSKHFGYGHQTFGELDSHDDPFVAWLDRRNCAIWASIPSGLPRGLVHGDVFADNTVFAGGRLAAILDFEEACVHPFAFDLGMAIVGTCHNGTGKIEPLRAQALLQGYEHKRALGSQERRSVPLFAQYAALCTAFWRFRQFRVLTPWPDRAQRYREMQTLVDELHQASGELHKLWFE
jgi:homoserine kinase type II